MPTGLSSLVLDAHRVRLSDLDLAAALLSLHRAQLVGHVSSDEPGRQEFVLEGRRDQVTSTTARYFLGDLLVEPRAFIAARRLLERHLREKPPLPL